jgi:hypothetical protein
MSEDERNSILDDLRIVKRFLGWLLGAVSAVGAALVAAGVSDHFTLNRVSGDVASMKPRVEVLWYKLPAAERYPEVER